MARGGSAVGDSGNGWNTVSRDTAFAASASGGAAWVTGGGIEGAGGGGVECGGFTAAWGGGIVAGGAAWGVGIGGGGIIGGAEESSAAAALPPTLDAVVPAEAGSGSGPGGDGARVGALTGCSGSGSA